MGVSLYDSKYFMVMWTIPEKFGGMTSMCLRRARNFRDYGGVYAPILCFDTKANHDILFHSLVERGYLASDMVILNVFSYYRSKAYEPANALSAIPLDLESLRNTFEGRKSLSTEESYDSSGHLFARITKNDKNVIVHRECFRQDGTVFFADVSSLDNTNKVLKRQIWLLNHDGQVVIQFNSANEFYRNWLLELAGGQRATFIFDDKVAATNLRHLDAPNIVKITPIHSNHMKSAADPVRGEIDPNRRRIFFESERWDGIVFLTERQRSDYVQRFGETSNLFVCPNPSSELPQPDYSQSREPYRGVMLGKLVQNKNMFSAIDIIQKVRAKIPLIKLDIYGEGPLKAALNQKIAELGLADNVQLHGYKPGAASQYASASFSLLTSRYEGFPMTLIESMGYGCPPISYDFRYGPASLIHDGENGFLVPNANVDAAAVRLTEICQDPALVRRLGEQAWSDSRKYSDLEVLQQWGKIVEQCWDQKGDMCALKGARAVSSKIIVKSPNDMRMNTVLNWDLAESSESIHNSMSIRLQLMNRTSGPAIEVPVRGMKRRPGRVIFTGEITQSLLTSAASEKDSSSINELFVIVTANNVAARLPIEPSQLDDQSWLPTITDNGQTGFYSNRS